MMGLEDACQFDLRVRSTRGSRSASISSSSSNASCDSSAYASSCLENGLDVVIPFKFKEPFPRPPPRFQTGFIAQASREHAEKLERRTGKGRVGNATAEGGKKAKRVSSMSVIRQSLSDFDLEEREDWRKGKVFLCEAEQDQEAGIEEKELEDEEDLYPSELARESSNSWISRNWKTRSYATSTSRSSEDGSMFLGSGITTPPESNSEIGHGVWEGRGSGGKVWHPYAAAAEAIDSYTDDWNEDVGRKGKGRYIEDHPWRQTRYSHETHSGRSVEGDDDARSSGRGIEFSPADRLSSLREGPHSRYEQLVDDFSAPPPRRGSSYVPSKTAPDGRRSDNVSLQNKLGSEIGPEGLPLPRLLTNPVGEQREPIKSRLKPTRLLSMQPLILSPVAHRSPKERHSELRDAYGVTSFGYLGQSTVQTSEVLPPPLNAEPTSLKPKPSWDRLAIPRVSSFRSTPQAYLAPPRISESTRSLRISTPPLQPGKLRRIDDYATWGPNHTRSSQVQILEGVTVENSPSWSPRRFGGYSTAEDSKHNGKSRFSPPASDSEDKKAAKEAKEKKVKKRASRVGQFVGKVFRGGGGAAPPPMSPPLTSKPPFALI